jgi:nanoRNase/pAp phosphatase (c-di-AMP/oligoRNAs hydrolase)
MCIVKEKYVRNYACPFLARISKKKGLLPVGAFVYLYSKNEYKFSMRAGDDTVDVSKIAAEYGGGGHKGAAAFVMDYDGIDQLIVKTINIKKEIQNTPL